MGDLFNLEEAMEVFIRNDKLDLIYFGEQRPEFTFKIKYFGLSMQYDALDIAFYIGRQYSAKIELNQSMIPEFILNSFLRSPKFYEFKIYFFKKYFTCFNVQQVQSLVE